MMREKNGIELINAIIPRGKHCLNKAFESDAEIVQFGNERLLFSTDEFSREDLFRENRPYDLGWNIAVGAISDILACGGEPLFFAMSLIVQDNWDKGYIANFSKGARDALQRYQVEFIGGDFGQAAEWRCTASVIGRQGNRAVTRKGAREGDLVFITGKVGTGNFEAALNLYAEHKAVKLANTVNNRFATRQSEARLVQRYAACCIDTSDGLVKSLRILAELNQVAYTVSNIPYNNKALVFTRLAQLPKELLVLGECGEYELLFIVRKADHNALIQEAKKNRIRLHLIGECTAPGRPQLLIGDDQDIILSDLKIEARDFAHPKEYLKELMQWLATQKNKKG